MELENSPSLEIPHHITLRAREVFFPSLRQLKTNFLGMNIYCIKILYNSYVIVKEQHSKCMLINIGLDTTNNSIMLLK